MYISVVDLFKIGLGPSSSHTVGPMRAARRFLLELPPGDLDRTERVSVELYGSLAHTGKGHGTDGAIILGLMGEVPDQVDIARAPLMVRAAYDSERITLPGGREIRFAPLADIRYNVRDLMPLHSNAMRFVAKDAARAVIAERVMYSIGGGFVVDEEEVFVGSPRGGEQAMPFPFKSAAELMAHCDRGIPLIDLLRANEAALRPEAETTGFLDRIIDTMFACMDHGMHAEGELPGGLRVTRRAADITRKLVAERQHANAMPHQIMDWVSVYAIAVNEENAVGGRVVTAPTNGAAGVVPAVLRYAQDFCRVERPGLRDFLLVAGAVGALCKMNASISGADVGCQGEVGSASAMAAAGLASALGASHWQVENAAEIALEHHLGMTCDPIGGLVQIPCIERNAMGAVKAISATSLAMRGDGTHRVSLDQVIDTMRRTGADMQSKYKETSQGGLALAAVEC